ncbi:MAG: transglutaminase domain-containing protein [Nitrospirae bacterium]|nr:transglutaminase domain-containing protein [Nitrospirota bacterium]
MKRSNVLILMCIACAIALFSSVAFAKERQGTVTIQMNVNAPADAKNVRVWIPYPMSDRNQDITNVSVSGNYAASAVYSEPKSKSAMLYAEWKEPAKDRTLIYTFTAKRSEVIMKDIPKKELPLSTEEFKTYLDNSWLGASEPKVKAEAAKIIKGKKTTQAKARAIYDWVVDNMRRDPNTKGCGLCDVERLLTEKAGKCADVHSVFTALCRAAGVPAREVWGINLPTAKEGDMTKMQHCWAEVYIPGQGWVVADPALVHKAALTKKMTPEELKKAKERDYYFGSIDENRIQLGRAEHVVLNPPQSGAPLIYFMYPYAEADGKQLGEDLFGFNIGYKISYKE